MADAQVIKTKEDGLVRDVHSKALLNTDRSALERNRALRAAHHKREVEYQELKNAYAHLERRLNELTQIVLQANSFIQA